MPNLEQKLEEKLSKTFLTPRKVEESTIHVQSQNL